MPKSLRTPWPADFPEVRAHVDERTMTQHADYSAAKAGGRDAAERLVDALICPVACGVIELYIDDRRPLIVPVQRPPGFSPSNRIPVAYARRLAERLGLEVWDGIVQVNGPRGDPDDAWGRLARPARFEGPVAAGLDCVLVDDIMYFGGTLSDLRGWIEHHGGRVILATTLALADMHAIEEADEESE